MENGNYWLSFGEKYAGENWSEQGVIKLLH